MSTMMYSCVILLALVSAIGAIPHYGSYNDYYYKSHGTRLCYYRGVHIPCHKLYLYKSLYGTQRPVHPGHHKTHYPPYYTTSTTTTTTTIDPVIQQSMVLRGRYAAARNISSGNLFAFTPEASNFFTTRIFDEIVRNDTGVCDRDLPPFTDCKIQELAFILANTPCVPRNGTGGNANSTSSNTDNMMSGQGRSRKRRMLTPGAVFNNRDGSITRINSCERRRDTTRNNNLRLCTACFATTTLPNRFPSFINEVICDSSADSCMSTTGACVENTITLTFLEDVNGVGIDRLAEWREYPQTIRSSCSCQIFQGSALSPFV